MPWYCFRGRYFEEEVQHHRHHSRQRHHSLHQNRRHAFFTGFLLFVAFLLFLLVGLSLPIIKSIYLLEVSAIPLAGQPETSTGDLLRFGVWGVCITSAVNHPTLFTNNGDCLGPMLGYTIDPTIIADITDQQELVTIVQHGVTILLVLHLVASALSLVTLLPVFLTCCIFHNAAWILSLIGAIVTGIISGVVFAADIALVVVARNQIQNAGFNNISVDFGNGVWMVLVGLVATWLAVVALSIKVCRCCGHGWKPKHYDPYFEGGH